MSDPGGPRRRTRALAAGLLLAALGIVVGRLVVDGRAALRAGDHHAGKGDKGEAIRRYGDAARLYVPGAPHVAAARARLQALATEAEGRGDLDTARRALEAERAALLGTRSFFTPGADRLQAIDGALARLYAALEDPARGTPEARVAWHAERLARRPGPALGPSLLALGGFALWIAAAVAFATRGLDRSMRLRRGAAAGAAAAFVLGFVLFLVGLRLA